jgi:alkanesulfonate monooxygenase SsuD/methylene tetrahydromethanopterin reductase-like flavin-dependent oxidoreductase (luciferase family)
MGHRTPLSVVEEFGLLAAACPGRIDLGFGRYRPGAIPFLTPAEADPMIR